MFFVRQITTGNLGYEPQNAPSGGSEEGKSEGEFPGCGSDNQIGKGMGKSVEVSVFVAGVFSFYVAYGFFRQIGQTAAQRGQESR